jgi:Mitochondrial carrier protein
MRNRYTMSIERRSTIPIELEDPEDCTVGEAESDYFPSAYEEQQRQQILSSVGTAAADKPQWAEPPSPPAAAVETLASFPARIRSEIVASWPKEMRNILAGGIAGMVAKSVVAPLDRVKILYQVSSAQFHLTAIPGVMRNIVRTEGVTALWKGNTATMIRVFPYSGIQFMVFDRCKHYFLQETAARNHDAEDAAATVASTGNARPPVQSDATAGRGINADVAAVAATRKYDRKFGLTPIDSLIAGMIAGTVSVICTYPLDLTRAQLAVILRSKSHPNRGFVRVLLDNYARSGVPGLFRGISPTLLGILPYSGIAFAMNEQGKREVRLFFAGTLSVARWGCRRLISSLSVVFDIEYSNFL